MITVNNQVLKRCMTANKPIKYKRISRILPLSRSIIHLQINNIEIFLPEIKCLLQTRRLA